MTDVTAVSGAPPRSVAAVLHDMLGNVDRMMRLEFRLAKAEARDELVSLGGAAKLVVAGAALGWFALGFLLIGAFLLLQTMEAPWLAAVIVGGSTALVAAALLLAGLRHPQRNRLASGPPPARVSKDSL